jgi:probable F420-dependent oxidoreductase
MSAVKHIEDLGFSTIFVPDHFEHQWEPVATMAAVAAVTEKINVGTSVFDVDYRHPVILAQASATIHMISNGRHEFGIGAGWLKDEYEKAGIPFDPAWKRIQRLEEAVKIIKSLWINETTSFEGKHYKINELPRVSPPLEGRPRLLIGGGGKTMLRLAGRHADIVNISASVPKGIYDKGVVRASSSAKLKEKREWILDSAAKVGRSSDELELSIWAPRIKITDDPDTLFKPLAERFSTSLEDIRDWTYLLYGSGHDLREKLRRWNENYGISYIIVAGASMEDIELFAKEVVIPLSKVS